MSDTAQRYRIGDLEIDVGRQRVTRGEEVIALPKLSYELLMALVRAAPNLVSIDGLMDQVWAKTVVSPETVSQRVKLLRDALDDDPRAPRYVEGLRGRGYRLIPPVMAPAPEPGVDSTEPRAPSTEVAAARPSRVSLPRSAILWGATVAVILLGLLLYVLHLARVDSPSARSAVEVMAVRPQAVAVLPFENLSSEPDNDYIALAVADSVLQQLAAIPDLIVVARSSSFALGKPVPEAREAGRRLGVQYLVTGSVQRAGKLFRVTAQLTDTTRNVALWSLKLDRTVDAVFDLQDQIAQRVAQQLDVTLHRGSSHYGQYGTDAYIAFFRGRALLESRKLGDIEESIRQFTRATELAPGFAAAFAELARAKWERASFQGTSTASDPVLQAQLDALVERALNIDPNAGEPYFLRALLHSGRAKDPTVEADFLKGIELAPNFGPGLRAYAEYLLDQERYDEAFVQLDRARLVDPLSAENHYRKGEVLRNVFYRYDDAAALYLQALSVQPEFYPAYTRLATVRWERGHLAEAIRYAEKSVAIEPAVGWTRARLIWLYVDLGDLPAARDVLRGFGPDTAAEAAAPQALVCYRNGKVTQAVALLRRYSSDADFHAGFDVFIALDAVVEQAISTHDPSTGRLLLRSFLQPGKAGGPLPVVDDDSFPAVMYLATLEHTVGDQALANDLTRHILEYLNRSPDAHLIGGWDEWARAAAYALLGQNDAAVDHLESLGRSNFRLGWWARIEQDPAFSRIRSTPRFQAIVAGTRVWLRDEQRQLEQMRSKGDVPRRSAKQLTADGC
jgi:TolB-like protein/DNA-binding winged helix-turn-helix (wHTH) protein/Tfp pilus assembly protein PilF